MADWFEKHQRTFFGRNDLAVIETLKLYPIGGGAPIDIKVGMCDSVECGDGNITVRATFKGSDGVKKSFVNSYNKDALLKVELVALQEVKGQGSQELPPEPPSVEEREFEQPRMMPSKSRTPPSVSVKQQ